MGKLWDARNGQDLITVNEPSLCVLCVAVTPDGKRLITGGADGTATVWDTANGRELFSLKGHSDCVWSVAVTPDGQRIVTGGADGTARLWDASTGRELLILREHTGAVRFVAVTPDGRRLIMRSVDGAVRIWEAATPEQVALWTRQEQEAAQRQAAWKRPMGKARGFIQDWLVLAPIPLQAGRIGAAAVECEQIPGEGGLRPRAGERVPVAGQEFTWRARYGDEPVLNLNRVVGRPSNNSVAYAVCYVMSATERSDLLLQVGSDDEAKVYLNGQEVYKYTRPRLVLGLDPSGPFTLRNGTNVLVLKVVNETGLWECCARFIDPEGNPAKGLRISLAPE